jgi:hypothetical protein
MADIDTTTQEIWKPIPEFENYEVSSLGCVRNRKTGRLLKFHINKKGYSQVVVSQNCNLRLFRVHRAVAAAFIGPCPKDLQVNHIDGDKANNRPENLEYVTDKQNKEHSVRLGLVGRGKRVASTKLTEQQVKEIRTRWAEGEAQRALARRFNVAQGTIAAIVHRMWWKHIT